MDVSRETVAAEVRAHLARHRVSGRQAALRLGWTVPYMSRRLSAEVAFDVDDLSALADLLGLPITAFFDRPVVSGGSGNLRSLTTLRSAA